MSKNVNILVSLEFIIASGHSNIRWKRRNIEKCFRQFFCFFVYVFSSLHHVTNRLWMRMTFMVLILLTIEWLKFCLSNRRRKCGTTEGDQIRETNSERHTKLWNSGWFYTSPHYVRTLQKALLDCTKLDSRKACENELFQFLLLKRRKW